MEREGVGHRARPSRRGSLLPRQGRAEHLAEPALQACTLPPPAHLAVSPSVSLFTPYSQFSQLVSGDVALLGGGPYMLCTDGQQLLRQVLHPEASRKVCHH